MFIRSVRIWDDKSDIEKTKKWLVPILNRRSMYHGTQGIKLEAITLTGRAIEGQTLGIDYSKIFPSWLEIPITSKTRCDEKLADYRLDDGDTFMDIIDAIPVFASFEVKMEDDEDELVIRIHGVKSDEDPEEMRPEVEIRACEISFI